LHLVRDLGYSGSAVLVPAEDDACVASAAHTHAIIIISLHSQFSFIRRHELMMDLSSVARKRESSIILPHDSSTTSSGASRKLLPESFKPGPWDVICQNISHHGHEDHGNYF